MKVVLLELSGDSARDKLAQLYPDAEIESLSRTEFETGGLRKRLDSLRARRPDVFAIATERLVWQRGQTLFMIFGALAGARESVMIDSHGGIRRETRFDLLAGRPLRWQTKPRRACSIFFIRGANCCRWSIYDTNSGRQKATIRRASSTFDRRLDQEHKRAEPPAISKVWSRD
jgi:hypothetical protein